MTMRFVFDPNRCIGCEACVMGCVNTHETATTHWRKVWTFNAARHPLLRVQHLSMACNHCEDPACLKHCPARAYTRDKQTGAIVHHEDRCLGCRYCTWACPFDSPRLSEEKGVIEKCDFCLTKLQKAQKPACVTACPVSALTVEDVTVQPASSNDTEWPPAFPVTPLRPAIRFVALRREAPPDMRVDGGRLAQSVTPLLQLPPPKLTPAKEWPVYLFSLIFPAFVAVFLSAWMGGPRLHPLGFLGLGVLAMGIALLHLAKKKRAWRVVMNLFSSWVSLEVLCVVLFWATGSWFLWKGGQQVAWWAVGSGLLGLIALDRLYGLARNHGLGTLHSAQAVITAAYLLGLLVKSPVLILSAGGVKLLLYIYRKYLRHEGFLEWLLSAFRIALGFISPLVFRERPVVAALCVMLGEMIDRVEFYRELEFESPARVLAVKMWRIFRPMDQKMSDTLGVEGKR